jgi:predicted RNA-binding protein YlqC (UPF0109 family)
LAVALAAVPALAARVTIEVSGQVAKDFTLVIQADGQDLGEVPLKQGQNAQAVVEAIVGALKNKGAEKISNTQFLITANQEIKLGEKGQTLQALKLEKDATLQNPINGINFKVVTVVVPTLTEWGLIALAALLAGGMGYMLYRRRPALRPAAP